jgi:signal transduction histidine kinase
MLNPRVTLLTILLAIGSASAQESMVDSLASVLDGLKDNHQKVKLLHRMVSSSWDFSFERAFQLAQWELELANKLNDVEAKTIAYTDLGMYYYFIGEYKQASQYYKQAMQAAGNNNFGEFPGYTMTRIANLYRVQGEYDSALIYYTKTEELLKGYPEGIALASLNFHKGWLLQELSKFRESFSYLYKARNIRNKYGDSLLIAECWRVIGASHLGIANTDSAQYYFDKVIGIARRFGDTELVILSSINMGDYYQARGETVASIKSYQIALDSLVKHDFKRYRALALAQIGRVFDSRGDHLKAIDYFYESMRLNEELNSRHQIALLYGSIGWAHLNLKNFQIAKEQGLLCLNLMRQIKDQAGEAFALNLLGNISFNEGDFLQANNYYDFSLRLRKELGLSILISNSKFNIARTYEKLGRLDEALAIYLESLKEADELHNFRILALCFNNIGALYTSKRDFTQAEKYLNKGLELTLQHGRSIDIRNSYYSHAKLYKLSGRAQKATEYLEKFIAINDSLLIQENALAAQQRDALYQLDKKNQEIKVLNERNKVREHEIEVQKNEIFFQRVILALILLALVLISIGAIILFRFNRAKSKVNEELYKLNKSIIEQREEIQAQAEELTEANQTIQAINKGLEVAIDERTQQLKQAFNELDTFIYRSSHDLRRPLTTFMGLAEVARISVKDPMAIELFDKVNETAQNLDRMLAKLQAVSQIASTELVAREVSFDMELDFVFNQYHDEILEKRIRVEREVKVKRWLSYPSLIRIIVENLIENAITFSLPENPFIRVLIEEEQGKVQLRIEDNGEGINTEFQNRLFEMYFRANERSKGNGLGLYLVKKATEKLKGTVKHFPNTPQGSVFVITLPQLES